MQAAKQGMRKLTRWNNPRNRVHGVWLRNGRTGRQCYPAIELFVPGGNQDQSLAGITLLQVKQPLHRVKVVGKAAQAEYALCGVRDNAAAEQNFSGELYGHDLC